MNQLLRLLIITFSTDLAAVFVARGAPFLGHDVLAFGELANLCLPLAFGLVYVPAALLSHRLCVRFTERRCLVAAYAVDAITCALTGLLWRYPGTFYVCMGVLGATSGLKWPVLESYISAGRVGREQARAIGLFNLAWASAFPVALVGAGPIIAAWPAGIFLLPAILSLAMLIVILTLPARPAHLPDGHPDRLGEEQLLRWGRLRTAGRLLNFLSQCAIGVLGALMPAIFREKLKLEGPWATGLSGLMDFTRLGGFFLLQYYTGWHDRRGPLFGSMLCMAAGFFMIVLGEGTAVVLSGEVLFGAGGAVAYYAALYYAMAVQNAAVEAGGVHEALIGLGTVLGPALSLAAVGLLPCQNRDAVTLAAMVPMFLLCAGAASSKLLGMKRHSRA